mmetsp:Transcript_33579/g.85046  ORF Transcript_33579/g.85046 Transcript_33579/m.85046 type:complete len:314 (+) Transcript_33579:537-1478(+)
MACAAPMTRPLDDTGDAHSSSLMAGHWSKHTSTALAVALCCCTTTVDSAPLLPGLPSSVNSTPPASTVRATAGCSHTLPSASASFTSVMAMAPLSRRTRHMSRNVLNTQKRHTLQGMPEGGKVPVLMMCTLTGAPTASMNTGRMLGLSVNTTTRQSGDAWRQERMAGHASSASMPAAMDSTVCCATPSPSSGHAASTWASTGKMSAGLGMLMAILPVSFLASLAGALTLLVLVRGGGGGPTGRRDTLSGLTNVTAGLLMRFLVVLTSGMVVCLDVGPVEPALVLALARAAAAAAAAAWAASAALPGSILVVLG